MMRFGVVAEVDPETVRARVTFDELGDIASPWLAVVQTSTKENKFYALPDVGDHVACLLDDAGDEGVIVGAIYSDADPAPINSGDKWHVAFKDGTTITYDRAAHKLTADVGSGEAEVKASKVTVTGDLKVTGKIEAGGNVTTPADVIAGSVSLKGHTHMTPGGLAPAPTSPPS